MILKSFIRKTTSMQYPLEQLPVRPYVGNRKLARFRAGIYAELPRKRTLFKLKLVIVILFTLVVAQAIPTLGQLEKQDNKKDKKTQLISEQEGENQASKEDEQGNGFFVEYVSGNSIFKEKEEIHLPSTSDTEEIFGDKPEEEVSGGTMIFESVPASYPKLSELIGSKYLLENLTKLDYLKENFYIVNATTKMTETDFNIQYFVQREFSIKPITTPITEETPQILIYHTHGSEGFADSREGNSEDTVVGVGELLAEILREKYGYSVLHDTTIFDKKDGKDNRNYAYSEALPYIEELLEKHPTIEVVIDLHRDAGTKRVVTIGNKKAAKVMLFNGLCRNKAGEKLAYLPNENLADNLAFSFQMKLIGDEMYPGLMNKIFLKDYRYNMHLMERYLLIELGTEQNTVEEAKNAMEPLADILAQVLSE